MRIYEKKDKSSSCPPERVNEELLRAHCVPTPDVQMNQLLSSSGWGTGFKLPFSNEENKLLEKKLEEKQAQVLFLSQGIDDDKEHVKEMKKHLERMNYDIAIAHNLLAAKLQDLESHKSTCTYAVRIKGKYEKDLVIERRQLQELKQRVQIKSDELDTRRATIKEFMSITDLKAIAMQKWEEHTKTVEDDINYVRKFAKLDEKHQTESETRQNLINQKTRQLSRDLNEKCKNTHMLQEQFTRTQLMFKKSHEERTEMISMWGRTIQAIKKRDLRLAELGEEYSYSRAALREINSDINEIEKALEDEIENKSQITREVHSIDKRLTDLKTKYEAVREAHYSLFQDHSNRGWELNQASGELKRTQHKINSLDEEYFALHKSMKGLEERLPGLRGKLEAVRAPTQDFALTQRVMEAEIKDYAYQEYICTEQLREFRKLYLERCTDRTDVEAELKRALKATQNTRNMLSNNQKQSLQQTILIDRYRSEIFHIDLRYNSLAKRFKDANGSSTAPANTLTQSKMTKVKERHKIVQEDRRLVRKDIGRSEIHVITRDKELRQAIELRGTLEEKLRHISTECERCEKIIGANSRMANDALVELSLENIVLKRLQSRLTLEQEGICDSSQVYFTLEGAMKERRVEIENYLMTNHLVLKSHHEALDKVRLYLYEVKKYVHRQKSTFMSIVSFFAATTEDGVEGLTSFQGVISKFVTERDSLQREAVKWKTKVTEAEVEILGLENNVKLLTTSNCQFKSSLSPVAPESCESGKSRAEETVKQTAQVRKRHATRHILHRRGRLDELVNMNKVTKSHILKMSHLCANKVRFTSMVDNELVIQRDKIHRWTNICVKLVIGLRGKLSSEQLDSIQQDLKLRCLHEKFEFGVLMLEKFVAFCPESKDMILDILESDSDLQETASRLIHVGLPGFKKGTKSPAYFNTDTYVNFIHELYDGAIRRIISDGAKHRSTRLDSDDAALANNLLEIR